LHKLKLYPNRYVVNVLAQQVYVRSIVGINNLRFPQGGDGDVINASRSAACRWPSGRKPCSRLLGRRTKSGGHALLQAKKSGMEMIADKALLVSITRPYCFRRNCAKKGITISHKHNILASIEDRLSLLPKGLDVLLVKAMSRVIVRAMYHRNHHMKLGGCHFHNKASRLGLANDYVLALQTQAWAVRNLCGDPELTALIIALDFAIAA